ncbi:L-seryl-tRNA(Sec) selenium transferase [Sporomusa carbonis]|uniref:L-seryl-tRNA(Sec) selenium transferase n=1 Tax=Sporomusa carbonis TaxID=3076075 RepID=UPI003A726E7C
MFNIVEGAANYMDADNTKLRAIPAIDRLLAVAESCDDLKHYPRELIAGFLRKAAADAREQVRQGLDPDTSPEALVTYAKDLLAQASQPSLRRLINATGVVLHTNLGRAPLSKRARVCVAGIMEGYSTLEYNVTNGQRGSRYAHVSEQLRKLTGAEDTLVVNNNAAAVMLVLSALAKGREVIVSRGELVEIGGSFRVPDVLKQSGATLVEVGTTNKTHLYDYEQAIGPNTAAILKVHTSNYCIVGFTSKPAESELAALAHKYNLPVIEDLGSGTLMPLALGGQTEPAVTGRFAAGFDIVTFSGDKLLGASQAGIIAGKAHYISMMKKHPLLRAIRIDKLSLAALEGTLMDYLLGNPVYDVPVLAMLSASDSQLKERALKLKELIAQHTRPGITIEVVRVESPAGGGALPAAVLTGYGVVVAVPNLSANQLESRLRQRNVPIIVRVQDDNVLFDVRCLSEADLEEIAQVLHNIM